MANSSIYAAFERMWQHVIALVGGKVDKVSGKDLSTNDYTTEEKEKLAGIAAGATANVGTITEVTGGDGLTGSATSGAVTLTVGEGNGISVAAEAISVKAGTGIAVDKDGVHNAGVRTIIQDNTDGHKLTINTGGTNNTITIPDNDTTYNEATTSAAGLMSAADKTFVDGITATVTELNYMSGVTSGVQTQLNDKVPTSRTINGKALTDNITLSAGDVSAYTKAEVDSAIANTGTITEVQANGTSVATSGTANIPAASTSAYGVTKLSSATNSTSTDLAATASAVKSAYDLANGAMPKSGGTFTGATYAQANTSYTTYQLRNIALSTSAATPTGNGAILGVYA